jgi:7,8-dihydropterin-6-yl-methyl-4-(beta-D-ribofuranosyl)aminobenzene 5'-phosphate synthase
MKVNITTLSENTANYGFIAEWGLSILVEVDEMKILMDTGQSFSAVQNAQLMGIDLSTINKVVLSHSHVDHTGGLREVLRRSGPLDVLAHPDVWATQYARRDKENFQYIGIPFKQEDLESCGARFNLSKEPIYITDRILTTGEVPMTTDYETIDEILYVRENGTFRPDKLADDLSLIIDTDFGLVVILGCAHRGIVNTLRHAQKLTGKEMVYAVIGGTHLLRSSVERLELTIADLRDMGIQRLGVSHCTGFAASARLAQEFGDAFFLNNAGTRLALP